MSDYSDYLKQAFDIREKSILLDAEKCKAIMLDLAPDYKSETELLHIVLQNGIGAKILALDNKSRAIQNRETKKIESILVSSPHIQLSQQNAETILMYICKALDWPVANQSSTKIVVKEEESVFSGFTDSVNVNIQKIPETKPVQPAKLLTAKDIIKKEERQDKKETKLTIIYTICYLAIPLIWSIKCIFDVVSGRFISYGTNMRLIYFPVFIAFPTIPVLIARVFYSKKSKPKQNSFSLVYALSFISSFIYFVIPITWFFREANAIKMFHETLGNPGFMGELIVCAVFWAVNFNIMKFLCFGTIMRGEDWNYYFI